MTPVTPDSLASATYAVLTQLPAWVLPAGLAVAVAACLWAILVVGRPAPRTPRFASGPQATGTSVRSVASGRQANRKGV